MRKIGVRIKMDNSIPPYHDFPECNEFSQSYLWPVTVKYMDRPEIHFSVSKSETIDAFHSIETVQTIPSRLAPALLKKRLRVYSVGRPDLYFFQLSRTLLFIPCRQFLRHFFHFPKISPCSLYKRKHTFV